MSTRRTTLKGSKGKRAIKGRTGADDYETRVNSFLTDLASQLGLCGKKGHSDNCRCDDGGPVRLKQ